MRTRLVLFAPILLACSSPVGESLATPEPEASAGSVPGCYSLALDGTPAEFVLPAAIELSTEPAPGSLDPLRFAVRELGGGEPRAPISSWALDLEGTLELVLGGGFTGYTFSLRPAGDGGWEGIGEYCSDMGVLPEPERLPLRLVRRSCS
jgi:hypothetical protein